jgi:hypothetical protein
MFVVTFLSAELLRAVLCHQKNAKKTHSQQIRHQLVDQIEISRDNSISESERKISRGLNLIKVSEESVLVDSLINGMNLVGMPAGVCSNSLYAFALHIYTKGHTQRFYRIRISCFFISHSAPPLSRLLCCSR